MFPFTSFAKSISLVQPLFSSILQVFQYGNGILNKIESFSPYTKAGNPDLPVFRIPCILFFSVLTNYDLPNFTSALSRYFVIDPLGYFRSESDAAL